MAIDLLKDPTNKVLNKMSLPISLGMLSTILFQVVDTYFVGTLGSQPLTALGFSSTIYFLMIGVFMGAAIAVSIMVGTAFGENNKEKVKQIATNGLIAGFLLAAFFSVIGYFTIDPLFTFLGADTATIPLIEVTYNPCLLLCPYCL
jgi:Na+-driven multidrug efflux pump